MTDVLTNPPPWPVIAALGCVGVLLLIALTALIVNMPPPPIRKATMSPFLKQLIERALKTLAQVAVALPIVTELLNKSLESTGGKGTLAAVALILSAVSSLVSKYVGDKGTASLVKTPEG